jgi:hypothetical protein
MLWTGGETTKLTAFLAQTSILLPVSMFLLSRFHSMINIPQVLGFRALCNRLQIIPVEAQHHRSEASQSGDIVGKLY